MPLAKKRKKSSHVVIKISLKQAEIQENFGAKSIQTYFLIVLSSYPPTLPYPVLLIRIFFVFRLFPLAVALDDSATGRNLIVCAGGTCRKSLLRAPRY